jgi:hypothetical protein
MHVPEHFCTHRKIAIISTFLEFVSPTGPEWELSANPSAEGSSGIFRDNASTIQSPSAAKTLKDHPANL